MTCCGGILNYIQTDCETYEIMSTKLLVFHLTVILNKGQGHSNWNQNVAFSGLYHHIKFERNWPTNLSIQVNVQLFFVKLKNMCGALSLEYWPDQIRWKWGPSNLQVSLAYQIPFKPPAHFLRYLTHNILLSCTLRPWSKFKATSTKIQT